MADKEIIVTGRLISSLSEKTKSNLTGAEILHLITLGGSSNTDNKVILSNLIEVFNTAVTTTETDCNNLISPGRYIASNMSNSPDGTTSGFIYNVYENSGTNNITQTAFNYESTSAKLYIRNKVSGTWSSAWTNLAAPGSSSIEIRTGTETITSGTGNASVSFSSSMSGTPFILGEVSGVNINVSRPTNVTSSGFDIAKNSSVTYTYSYIAIYQ